MTNGAVLVSAVALFRLRIRHADAGRQSAQPDIPIDLQPQGDRFSGWATIPFRDGTGSGHSGATADAWRISASGEGR